MTYPADVLALNPSAFWRLIGDGQDASPNDRDITPAVGATYPTDGGGWGPGAFRGTATIASAAWMNLPAALSWAVWFKSNGPNAIALVGRSDSPITGPFNNQWACYVNATGKVVAQTWQANGVMNGDAQSPATTYHDGAWHMAAGVWTSGGLVLYVDGVAVTTVTAAAALYQPGFGTYVGHFNGNMLMTANTAAEVGVPAVWYGTALTAPQIAALYTAGIAASARVHAGIVETLGELPASAWVQAGLVEVMGAQETQGIVHAGTMEVLGIGATFAVVEAGFIEVLGSPRGIQNVTRTGNLRILHPDGQWRTPIAVTQH